MSTPFWIFVAALCVICLSALASRHLFSRRIAKHAKAEEALDARMAAFKERVSARNERILAAEKPKASSSDERTKADPNLLGKRLYVSRADHLIRRYFAEPKAGGSINPGRFAGGGDNRRLALLDNGRCVWLEENGLTAAGWMPRVIDYGDFTFEPPVMSVQDYPGARKPPAKRSNR